MLGWTGHERACHEVLFAAYTESARWADAATHRAPMRVWALIRAGRFDDAEQVIDEILAKDPDHHSARVARFDIAAERGWVAEALKRAEAILGDTSHRRSCWRWRSTTSRGTGW